MSDVLETLHSFDQWMQLTFFLNGNMRLGGQSLLEALRQGRIADVLRAARAYGEHGAG